ncbi:hypothetical protein Pmani_008807 [Petrolisthes manimaculis]|uniref:Uncharacterized protein n=1 Tax=Petrolisthes manimaculis TaxID=1843537 RepID=A0AAE1UIJ1_9EUCA|nr:hypothetical protein Pmani_008807 [Petrolisthes manimaculis]
MQVCCGSKLSPRDGSVVLSSLVSITSTSTEARQSVLVSGDRCAGTYEVVVTLSCKAVTATGGYWVDLRRDVAAVASVVSGKERGDY